MDIKMPVMNGFEATEKIKQIRESLPIIAQTAYTSDEDKDKAYRAGCDGYITKPLTEAVVIEILEKHLNTNK
jgi:CheY-like chemotaxis protein